MPVEKILFLILRSELSGEALGPDVRQALSAQTLAELYTLSNAHDMAHIAGQAISKLGGFQTDESFQKMKLAARKAFVRYVKMENALQRICTVLEQAQIPFIPLKGAVIRPYYPEPWMRTSCDIDILVKEKDLSRAVKAIVKNLSYRDVKKSLHDISMHSPEGIHLELHHALIEDFVSRRQRELLSHIWEYATPVRPSSYNHQLAEPVFYFYHIAHMAKHFQNGGCGIKPLMDLWLLNHKLDQNTRERELLLEEGGLLTFSKAAEKLSRVWFGDGNYEPLDRVMERYILDGGVYGTRSNIIVVSQYRKGNRLLSVFERVFLPYDVIKYYYPVLKKHKYLTPVFQIARWCKLFFQGKFKTLLWELNKTTTVTTEELSSISDLMNYLGL